MSYDRLHAAEILGVLPAWRWKDPNRQQLVVYWEHTQSRSFPYSDSLKYLGCNCWMITHPEEE